MKQVIRYQCEYCKKEFKTPDRHICRKKPELKNCYTCEHWLRQFVISTSWNGDEYRESCSPEEACQIDGCYAQEAFEIMREKGWQLDCPDWKGKASH
jgi:hypothetical protein